MDADAPDRARRDFEKSGTDQDRSQRRNPDIKLPSVSRDRFIPNRDGQDLQATFSLLHDDASPAAPSKMKESSRGELHFRRTEEANRTYERLLRSELMADLGPDRRIRPVRNSKNDVKVEYVPLPPRLPQQETSSSQSWGEQGTVSYGNSRKRRASHSPKPTTLPLRGTLPPEPAINNRKRSARDSERALPRQGRLSDGETLIADINNTVRKALSYDTQPSDKSPRTIAASIVVQWGFCQFLESQFEDSLPRTGSVLTLTGSVGHAQATTCDAYVQSTWPVSGPSFNVLLQQLSDSGNELRTSIQGGSSHTVHTTFERLMPELSLRVRLQLKRDLQETVGIDATGPIERVQELVQQLAWAGAAFSAPPSGDDIAYARPLLTAGSLKGELFLEYNTQPIRRSEDSCWLPLFSGACIASGFPVPPRLHGHGLEIPLHILAALVGAGHAVECAGGIVIKGFSSMIIPIRKAGNIVQWHLIVATTDERRLSYHEGLGQCGERALLDKIDFDCLRTTRAILGWCTTVECALGSRDANYDIADYSRATRAEATLSLTGGTLGLQQFAVGQLDFRLGAKDGKCHFQRSGPYLRILNAAEKTPIVLYDTSDRRGWLVTAAEVILHMCHHRNHREPFEVAGESVDLPGVEPGCSVRNILIEKAQLDLYDPVDGRYTLKDMVLNCWSLIEFLVDQNLRKDHAAGTVVQTNLVETIQGYEYMALVDERSPFQRKQSKIAKSSGGWLNLTQDIDALVLFASGFGEVMRPKRDENFEQMCTKWHRVPKEKDYLAASVKVLKDLYDVAGCRRDRKYLTSTRLQWHRGDSIIFESCDTPQEYRCDCDRLQQILPGFAIGKVVGPGPLIDDYLEGAVIFGQSESRLMPRRRAREEPRARTIYGQANSTFVVSGVHSQRDGLLGDEHTDPRNTEDDAPDTVRSLHSAASNRVCSRAAEGMTQSLHFEDSQSESSQRLSSRASEIPFGKVRRDLQQNETRSAGPLQADKRHHMPPQGKRREQQKCRVVQNLDHADPFKRPFLLPR